jgi:hypothetical protein
MATTKFCARVNGGCVHQLKKYKQIKTYFLNIYKNIFVLLILLLSTPKNLQDNFVQVTKYHFFTNYLACSQTPQLKPYPKGYKLIQKLDRGYLFPPII